MNVGTGTLDELVAGVNQAGTGVTATKLALGNGVYRVSLASADTGTGSTFTLSNLTAATTPTPGQNAKITVAGDQIDSPSNTFTDLLQGVDCHDRPGHAGPRDRRHQRDQGHLGGPGRRCRASSTRRTTS